MSTELHALAGAYALDALPADEREDFEAHLSGCEACRVEVAELQATAARLGEAASDAPPPGLRDRVLAETDQVRQLPPLLPPSPSGELEHGVGDELGARRERRTVGRVGRVALGAAAAVVLAVTGVLGVLAADLHGQVGDAEQQVQALSRVLSAPDARTAPGTLPDGGHASVVVSRSRGEVVLATDGMADAPEGETYQAWLVHDGGPVPAGVFEPDGGRTLRELDGDLAGATAVAVTVEPDGGSAQPTSDPVLAVDLPS